MIIVTSAINVDTYVVLYRYLSIDVPILVSLSTFPQQFILNKINSPNSACLHCIYLSKLIKCVKNMDNLAIIAASILVALSIFLQQFTY